MSHLCGESWPAPVGSDHVCARSRSHPGVSCLCSCGYERPGAPPEADPDPFADSAELLALVDQLGPDELAVVLEVARRLIAGRKVYGPLAIARDPRDYAGEAFPELLDAAAYLAMEVLRHRRAGAP